MHEGMPYGRNQGQGHSREVDRQSPTGLIFHFIVYLFFPWPYTIQFVGPTPMARNSSFVLSVVKHQPLTTNQR